MQSYILTKEEHFDSSAFSVEEILTSASARRRQTSRDRHPETGIQRQASRGRHPETGIQRKTFQRQTFQRQASKDRHSRDRHPDRHPETDIPETDIQTGIQRQTSKDTEKR